MGATSSISHKLKRLLEQHKHVTYVYVTVPQAFMSNVHLCVMTRYSCTLLMSKYGNVCNLNNWKISAQFENQTSGVCKVYLCMKKLHFISLNWRKENSIVACGFSPIEIHYSDYLKRINEVYVFK